jgi:pimeloyl-ACP methyl ester carboxylesterase
VKDVWIATGGPRIHGKLVVPASDRPAPAVLFAHGWGSSQRQDLGKAKRLADAGFACLTFNFRGHARTRRQVETVSRADNLRDLREAFDCLVAQDGIDGLRIALVGASYGAYLATLLLAERRVRWLALQAPAIYKDADFDRPKRELNLDGDLGAYRQRRLAPGENRALACAARFTGDVLIVESEHDTVIPHAVVQSYVDAFERAATSVAQHVIPGADHGLSEERWRREYGRVLGEWLGARAGAERSYRRRVS